MIFGLHFILTLTGYASVSVLLGSYMMRYCGANEMDLGTVFVIQPISIFARPIICAKADRQQSHKQLLIWCLFGTAVCYIPLIGLPFLLEDPDIAEMLAPRLRFWALVFFHLIGSLTWCGVRSLGDALTVNYAKRIGSNFTCYRKFGALSFGISGFLLGHINQGWILPDYTPTIIVFSLSLSLLGVLVHLWPDEFFVIVGEQNRGKKLKELPNGKEILAHMKSKLYFTIMFKSMNENNPNEEINRTKVVATTTITNTATESTCNGISCCSDEEIPGGGKGFLTIWQQVRILMLLMRRDIRLPLFLLLLLYGGLIGYAPQNFVFTYVDQVCHQRKTCEAASLVGLIMIVFCISETTCYVTINALRSHLNYIIMIEITFISLTVHYLFYGFFVDRLSPYFFLIEALHGLEYSSSLSTSMELGYKFANEVEILVPELIQRGIISKHDDQQLIKVSLMATMNACFTLVYDGVGSLIGAPLYGFVIDYYSFQVVWGVIGSMAMIGFFTVIVTILIGKCFNIKPQIYEIESKLDPVMI